MRSIEKKPLWEPADVSETNVAKFIAHVNKRHNLQLQTYHDLHRWSVAGDSLQDFWGDAYSFLELAPPNTQRIGSMLEDENTNAISLFPPPRCFASDTLNIAEFLLRNGRADNVAIHFVREGVPGIERVTWQDLRNRTAAFRDAMVNSDIQVGDVVASVISNSVDAIVLCLATLSIGALWSSASCELGVDAIVDRFAQVNPKIIFADDGYIYGGKLIQLEDRISQWSHKLGQTCGLSTVVVIPYCKVSVKLSRIHTGCSKENFLRRGTGQGLSFKFLPFSHPAFILYSSGTTGTPKCIVHSAGGATLKVKTDMILQHDVREGDVVFQYTTTAWVMWLLNFINLSSGASMLLYDGSPFHPHPTVLLRLAEEVGVSIFGTSPRYLAELKSRGIVPREEFNLNKLRVVTSTGAVLSNDVFNWFYNKGFPPKAQLISMSGGTDIAGCFVGGTPLLPVYAGEIQVKALGMAVDILDAARDDCISVEHLGQAGELVCTKPFPSQPVAFWGKGGSDKYRSSYFERFGPQVWCQGDFVQAEKDTGGLIMLGRSDGVLNPSGVRFGSADIYSVTETMPEIDDSMCVGQRRSHDSDERVLLFVKMKQGHRCSSSLITRLKTTIRAKYSPRHVPSYIFEVADIPYTVNGKKCEINVKQIVSGQKTAVSGTVANPNSLKLYEEFLHLPADQSASPARPSKL
ncbi:MAG: hypothetical protein M1818_001341 [Claussenomyces sp. TS43310]|nr:MAG: hypothetical protein M1818_001341 [Claussenomyces sp. TS43310]